MYVIPFFWLILLLSTLPAYAQLFDDSANREHVFPLVVDGDGFRSYLVLTNVSDPGNQCTLELHGPGLDAGRFDANTALTTTDAGATIELAETGSILVLATAGEQTLTFGYAKLDCTKTVAARMLLTQESAGLPITMTTMESAQPGKLRFRQKTPPLSGPVLVHTRTRVGALRHQSPSLCHGEYCR